VVVGKAFSRLGALSSFSSISLHDLFMLLVMGLGPRFLDKCRLVGLPVCICTFRCGLLFGFRSFHFSSLIPLLDVFPLLTYLFQMHFQSPPLVECAFETKVNFPFLEDINLISKGPSTFVRFQNFDFISHQFVALRH